MFFLPFGLIFYNSLAHFLAAHLFNLFPEIGIPIHLINRRIFICNQMGKALVECQRVKLSPIIRTIRRRIRFGIARRNKSMRHFVSKQVAHYAFHILRQAVIAPADQIQHNMCLPCRVLHRHRVIRLGKADNQVDMNGNRRPI